LIHTERISAWLQEPHQLQEIAPEAILQLTEEYPFFAPPHYFLLVNGTHNAEKRALLQQQNPVNPVMLGNFLRAAAMTPAAETTEIPVAAETVITATQTVMQASVAEPEVIPEPQAASILPETAPVTTEEKQPAEALPKDKETQEEEELLIQPLSGEDYFRQQGIEVSNDIVDFTEMAVKDKELKEKSLMVVMSFAEWLKYISSNSKKAREEEEDKKALKAMWQQQKLAAAIEEEGDEIPEQVFEMAVNSIARKEELVSESLANVYAKQGKVEKAIEMYQKLSLQNPEKNAYFASKIEKLQKEI